MVSENHSWELCKVGVSAAVLVAGVNVAVSMSASAAGADSSSKGSLHPFALDTWPLRW